MRAYILTALLFVVTSVITTPISAQAAPTVAQLGNDRVEGAVPLSGWTATSTVDPAGARRSAGLATTPYLPSPGTAFDWAVMLWWTYTPPSDGEVSVSVTTPTAKDPASTPTGGINSTDVFVYDRAPVGTSKGGNYFDVSIGVPNRVPSVPAALVGIDGRFWGKAGQPYYIGVRVPVGGRVDPITVGASTSVGESGWYWQGAQAGGSGYAVEFRQGRVFLGLFLYNDDGSPNWLIATGDLKNGNQFDAELQQWRGGKSILYAQAGSGVGSQVSSPGTVSITWTGRGSASMTIKSNSGIALPQISITRYVFDPGTGWMGTRKPQGAHNTGWYWLPEDGGGRGWFGEAQGSSEFWVVFHYDSSGKATWHVANPVGLPTGGTSPYGCSSTFYPLVPYSGGQTLTGSYKQAKAGATLIKTDFYCDTPNTVSSGASSSSLGAQQVYGSDLSSSLWENSLILNGITSLAPQDDGVSVTPGPGATAYTNLCVAKENNSGFGQNRCYLRRFQAF